MKINFCLEKISKTDKHILMKYQLHIAREICKYALKFDKNLKYVKKSIIKYESTIETFNIFTKMPIRNSCLPWTSSPSFSTLPARADWFSYRHSWVSNAHGGWAGSWRDDWRQVSSFDKKTQEAALLPGTEPSCSGDRGNWCTASQLLLWCDCGKVPRLVAQKTH